MRCTFFSARQTRRWQWYGVRALASITPANGRRDRCASISREIPASRAGKFVGSAGYPAKVDLNQQKQFAIRTIISPWK
jgi:hypothetical protein